MRLFVYMIIVKGGNTLFIHAPNKSSAKECAKGFGYDIMQIIKVCEKPKARGGVYNV